jgi:hypothetical protein
MKKFLTIFAVMTLIMSVGSTAQAMTIRDNPDYVASTGLTLGDRITVFGDVSGFAITEAFQINLEYQAGILDSEIDAINSYDPDGTWDLNFSDNEEYVFDINLAGLTIYEYDGMAETFDSGIQWTLTAWHQTILAGYIDGQKLMVSPASTYRPFVNDPPVNDVEVFDGMLDTEVIAYTFTGVVGDIGDGSVLGVQVVPEPSTMLLLGAGLIGLAGFRRKNKKV